MNSLEDAQTINEIILNTSEELNFPPEVHEALVEYTRESIALHSTMGSGRSLTEEEISPFSKARDKATEIINRVRPAGLSYEDYESLLREKRSGS